MKAGNICRFLGRQLFYTLAAFFLTSIFIWSWEKNPLLTSIHFTEDEFFMTSSDMEVDTVKEYPKPEVVELTRDGQSVEGVDLEVINVSSTFYPKRKDGDGMPTSPFEKKEGDAGVRSQSTRVEGTRDKKAEQIIDGDSINTSASVSMERNDSSQNQTFFFDSKACNYAKGRWVADSRRPLYSGLGCKQWLSYMWACRLTQRTDFSYEGYRWQPENCEMPQFEGSEFLKRMQDKTIAFIGDSLGRQQFQSLLCMVTGGKERLDVENVGWKYGLIKPRGAIRPEGWAYQFPETNATILYYWSATLSNIEPINATDPATEYAMHLDRPPAFLSHYLDQFDVVVFNTAHHWNRGKLRANRWVMYVNGTANIDRHLADIWSAKNFTVNSIVRWMDFQITLRPQLKAFFRTISPRHFANGDWNTGGSCDSTIPLARGSEVLQDESYDPIVAGAVNGTKVKILDITAISQLRDEAHISRYSTKASVGVHDCLHWCLPGIPDMWNEILCAQL